jgi:hypothetical protein
VHFLNIFRFKKSREVARDEYTLEFLGQICGNDKARRIYMRVIRFTNT